MPFVTETRGGGVDDRVRGTHTHTHTHTQKERYRHSNGHTEVRRKTILPIHH